MSRTAAKIALLGAVGIASVGLAACGSGSSDSATTATVTKEAGFLKKDVQLAVDNRTDTTVSLKLCQNTSAPDTCQDFQLSPGKAALMTAGGIEGTIDRPPDQVSISALNPGVGEPRFILQSARTNERQNVDMVEGQVTMVDLAGHTYQVEREGDADDAKVMRLILLS